MLDGTRGLAGPGFHLSFVNHVKSFNTPQGDSGTPKRFESKHGPNLLFDESMILFNNVIEILTLSDLNAFMVFLGVAFDSCFVGPTLVDVNLGGLLIGLDRFVQKPQSRLLITFCRENKINGEAAFINRTVEILPLAFDRNIGLIHTPTSANRPLSLSKFFFHGRSKFQNPAVEGGMVHIHPAFFHHFFEVPVA